MREFERRIPVVLCGRGMRSASVTLGSERERKVGVEDGVETGVVRGEGRVGRPVSVLERVGSAMVGVDDDDDNTLIDV